MRNKALYNSMHEFNMFKNGKILLDISVSPPYPVPGIISATVDPPGCPQKCDLPLSQYGCPKKLSEDCLYLNIFMPLNATVKINLNMMV